MTVNSLNQVETRAQTNLTTITLPFGTRVCRKTTFKNLESQERNTRSSQLESLIEKGSSVINNLVDEDISDQGQHSYTVDQVYLKSLIGN